TYGFHATDKSWVTIEGFEIRHTESRSIYFESDCTDGVIARNHVTLANSYGIESSDGIRLRIEENVISDGNYHGIGLTAGSRDCLVRDNESFRNRDPAIRRANGIYLYSSYDNTLVGNRLHDNQDS